MADVRFSVGDIIRLMRSKQHLSARQLSAMAGLSPSYVGKLEAGECEPSLKAFARVANALRLRPTEVWYLVNLAAEEDAE